MKTKWACGVVGLAALLCFISCGGHEAPPANLLPAPTLTPDAGTYPRDVDVIVWSDPAGAEIYYTTDGTDPTTDSTRLWGSIPVHGYGTSMTIKAIAVSGQETSHVGSASYTITGNLWITNYNTTTGAGGLSAFTIGSGGALGAMTPATMDTGIAPSDIAIHPIYPWLYVPNLLSGTVSAYGIGATGSLTPIATASTGLYNENIAIAPNGSWLYATSGGSTGANGIIGFSVGANGALTAFTSPGPATGPYPWGLAISPNGQYLYAANSGGSTISAFTIGSDGALTDNGSYAAGTNPRRIAITPNGAYLYAINHGSGGTNGLSGFEIGSDGHLTVIASGTFTTGAMPTGIVIAPNGTYLYVSHGAGIWAYSRGSGGTLTDIGHFTAGSDPSGMAISPDGKYLYATNTGSSGANGVSAFEIRANGSLTAVTSGIFATGSGPSGIAIMP